MSENSQANALHMIDDALVLLQHMNDSPGIRRVVQHLQTAKQTLDQKSPQEIESWGWSNEQKSPVAD